MYRVDKVHEYTCGLTELLNYTPEDTLAHALFDFIQQASDRQGGALLFAVNAWSDSGGQ